MAKAAKLSDEQPPFEELFRRIEEIISQLEGGRLSLNDSLTGYEEAVKHLRSCFEILEKAEERVALVTGIAPDGTPLTENFQEDSATLEEKSDRRSSRRTARSPLPPGQQSLLDEE